MAFHPLLSLPLPFLPLPPLTSPSLPLLLHPKLRLFFCTLSNLSCFCFCFCLYLCLSLFLSMPFLLLPFVTSTLQSNNTPPIATPTFTYLHLPSPTITYRHLPLPTSLSSTYLYSLLHFTFLSHLCQEKQITIAKCGLTLHSPFLSPHHPPSPNPLLNVLFSSTVSLRLPTQTASPYPKAQHPYINRAPPLLPSAPTLGTSITSWSWRLAPRLSATKPWFNHVVSSGDYSMLSAKDQAGSKKAGRTSQYILLRGAKRKVSK